MIILDTNVVSAVMLAVPDPHVIAWLDRCPPESVWTTAVTVFEVRLGIELLAAGRQRKRLEQAFDRALAEDFQGRVLSFDEAAALAAAVIVATARRQGRPVDIRDAQIAGIATARRGVLATRNSRHFRELEIDVVDPWEEQERPRRK
ncbi:MAG: type II toxin-antitoxin system VapC family toxin [Deltaproteobacteria bacterium]|nr:type II toxin-antitoxin system VapC family toxin [Deltaproteobacteria bacterium]